MPNLILKAGALLCTLMLCSPLRAEIPAPPAAKPESLKLSKRVLIIGDSNTHNGHLNGEMMRLLETEHGYFGSGYRSIVANVGNGQKDAYQPYLRIKNEGEWKSVTFIGGVASAVLSPDGTCLQSSDASHTAEVEFAGTSIDIYYAARPKGGAIKAEVAGRPAVQIATAAETIEIRRHRIEGLPMQAHTLRLSPSGDGEITLCGVESYTVAPDSAKAAVIHKWGRSYAATTHFAGLEPAVWESALKLLKPDCVVIMLGTNDHMNFVIAKPVMLNNLAELAQRVQRGAPQSRLVIVSTVPVGDGLSYSARLRERYREALPELSATLGATYWDLAQACGGSHKAWIERGETTDKIHFNLQGAKVVAPLFLDAIVQSLTAAAPVPEKLMTKEATPGGERPKFESLNMWLSADGPLVLDASDRVVQLDNIANVSYLPPSRRVLHARSMVPSMRPRWVPNVVSGKPVVRFDGKSNSLALPFDTGAAGFAMVMRVNKPGGALFGASLALYKRFGPAEGNRLIAPEAATESKSVFYLNGKPLPNDAIEAPLGEFVIFSAEGGGGIAIIGANEHYQRYTKGPGDPETLSHFDGEIAELITWNRLAPKHADQRAQVEQYLAQKYGIALQR